LNYGDLHEESFKGNTTGAGEMKSEK